MLTTVALLVGLVPAASAFHSDAPVHLSGGGAGTGWASYSFTTDGTTAEHEIEMDGIGLEAQMGVLLFDDEDSPLGGLILTAWSTGTGAQVDVQIEGFDGITVDTYEQSGGGFAAMAVGFGLESGTYKVLVWAAGEASSWTYKLLGEEGVTSGASNEGADTFLFRARDFQGPLSAQASSGAASVRAQIATSQVVEIENGLFGSFSDVVTSADVLTASTPDGEETCPCYYLEGAGPGTYTFGLTGAGVTSLGEVFLGGADATLVG